MKNKIVLGMLILGLAAGAGTLAAQQTVTFSVFPHAWLGVELQDVSEAKVKDLHLPGDYGAIVIRVMENSPAAKAALRAGDVIVDFGVMRVWSVAQLARLVRETPVGRTVRLDVIRAGKRIKLEATLERSTQGPPMGPFFHLRIPPIHIPQGNFGYGFAYGTGPVLGIQGQMLTPQLAKYFGVQEGHGVLIEEVEPGSPAARAGLEAGDCIIKINSTEVDSLEALHSALSRYHAEKGSVTLEIVRHGHKESVQVNLGTGWHPAPSQVPQSSYQNLWRRFQKMEQRSARLENREKQIQSCLMALESHLFAPKFSNQNPKYPVVRQPNGSYVVAGPGCSWPEASLAGRLN